MLNPLLFRAMHAASCMFALTMMTFSPVQLYAAEQSTQSEAQQCPALIGKAIDTADVAAFERLVDVDGILSATLNLFLREVQKPEVAGQLPPILTLMFSRAAAENSGGDGVRALLLREARAFITNGVSSGAFAGHKISHQTAQGLLAPLFADASIGRKEIREIGEGRPDKHDWLVPFVVHDAGNDESYPVRGRFSPVNDGFRLIAVDNMDELMRRIMAEAQNLTK